MIYGRLIRLSYTHDGLDCLRTNSNRSKSHSCCRRYRFQDAEIIIRPNERDAQDDMQILISSKTSRSARLNG